MFGKPLTIGKKQKRKEGSNNSCARNQPQIASVLVGLWALLLLFMIPQINAEVTRLEINSRDIFADGIEFGTVGVYEKIKGRLYYSVDPNHPANAGIVDLKLAPQTEEGKVVFSGEFILLKPVDLKKGNHRLLYDVNNRGNLYMLRYLNSGPRSNDPSDPEHAGNGFLMRQGYSLLWTGWNWDVRIGNDRLQIDLPIISDNGKLITQEIAAEIVLSTSRKDIKSQPLAWGSSRCYPAVDADDNSKAILTVRDEPRGKRVEIPRYQWRFAKWDKGHVLPDPTYLYLEAGFMSGKIYELIYEAKNPRVVGLGLASIRDAISFFRYKNKDRTGTPNPLAVRDSNGNLMLDPDKAYIFGVSQSGRVIVHTIFEGFHVNEDDQMVFDGAFIHVAGGGKGGFNHRFAQTTHHSSHLEGNYMPADFFPFNYAPQKDPITGEKGNVLAVAEKMGKIPYILVTNNELEYWTRAASLIHTDVNGSKDAPVHEKVRIYMTNSAPHGNAGSRNQGIYEHPMNTINHSPVLRALLIAMDQWVTDCVEPPASRYPRCEKGELLSAAEHKKRFPAIPGIRHPGRNLQPPRVNYGDKFWSEGIFSAVPPQMGEPYKTMVPNFDRDGNSLGGIRLPELLVPLGTYQAWNPRRAEFGAPEYLGRFVGSFWEFAGTEEERKKSGDERPSLEERYPNKETYVKMLSEAVKNLTGQGFLLEEDGKIYIANAEAMVWPPEQTERPPFWKMNQ
ncbi:alpha/beta hydrolase domain-containing protein [Acidobacteriota bacterium]